MHLSATILSVFLLVASTTAFYPERRYIYARDDNQYIHQPSTPNVYRRAGPNHAPESTFDQGKAAGQVAAEATYQRLQALYVAACKTTDEACAEAKKRLEDLHTYSLRPDIGIVPYAASRAVYHGHKLVEQKLRAPEVKRIQASPEWTSTSQLALSAVNEHLQDEKIKVHKIMQDSVNPHGYLRQDLNYEGRSKYFDAKDKQNEIMKSQAALNVVGANYAGGSSVPWKSHNAPGQYP